MGSFKNFLKDSDDLILLLQLIGKIIQVFFKKLRMIKELRRDFRIKEPIVSTYPFPYIVIDDFISRNLCEQLIKDSDNLDKKNINIVHGGRRMITWKSSLFRDITKESSAWRNLEKELPKRAFNLFNQLITDKAKKSEIYHKWGKGNP